MELKDDLYLAVDNDIISTLEVEETSNVPHAVKLGGHTNLCLRVGNILIKKIIHGNLDIIDNAYTQLAEKKLFGITNYQRFDDIVILPFIEGYVTEDISVKEFMYLSDQIRQSGIKPRFTLFDLFDRYNFNPDKKLYGSLLKDTNDVCHGDLAYINIIRTEDTIIPIDWEFFCYANRYWDLGCFLASLYVLDHANTDEIRQKTEEVADPTLAALNVMLLCDYWRAMGDFTGNYYYPKELKVLRDYLLNYV